MYKIYICTKINENIYDIKLSLSKLKELCKKYKLEKIGEIKEYYENNVLITVNKNDNNIDFNYIIDKKITYDEEKNFLIQEYNKIKCIPYNFSNVSIEESYVLYKNKIDNIEIFLKKYEKHFSLEFLSDELNQLKNLDNFLYLI